MKTKFIIISLFGLILLTMTSCPGVRLDGGHSLGWGVYLKTCDSLLVECPRTVYKNERPVTSNRDITFESMEICKDSFLFLGDVWIKGMDVSNVEVHVYRQTSKDDVRIFFIHADLIRTNVYNPDNSYNYHVLDSLMDIYGVTMPANQSTLTLPITTIWDK